MCLDVSLVVALHGHTFFIVAKCMGITSLQAFWHPMHDVAVVHPYWKNESRPAELCPLQEKLGGQLQKDTHSDNRDILGNMTGLRRAPHDHNLVINRCGQVTDPSLLRFLVDMLGADLSEKQLRDDLMTMLIAGHETTAAVLTWTLFALLQHPKALATVLSEIDTVLGDRIPGVQMPCVCGLLDTAHAVQIF